MPTFDEIKRAVEKHKAAYEEYRKAAQRVQQNGSPTLEDRIAEDSYNSQQDAAITMLEALLPVVEAAVAVYDTYDEMAIEWQSKNSETAYKRLYKALEALK